MKPRTLRAMKKWLIATLLVVSPGAFAQPHMDSPSHESGRATDAPAADQPHVGANEQHGEHAGGHHEDPTKHWNWASNWFSYGKKDVYGGPLGDGKMVDHDGNVVMHPKEIKNADGTTSTVMEPAEEEGMSPPFVFMLLNFGILLIILAKFGGPVAAKSARERSEQISTALEEAAKLREQAQNKLTEYENRIKDVDAEVKKLVDGIRADADADKARILAAAAKQAEQMKKDADLRIAAEIDLARAALQREVAVAATGATEKLLREKVTGEDQTKLVTTFIGNVASGGASKEAR
jgi:F0F1-type ATP synthase membrane subunit b/b'